LNKAAVEIIIDSVSYLAIFNSSMNQEREIQNFADSFFSEKMEQYHVPGVALVVVKDGKTILSQGYGYANLEKKIPVIPEKTLFRAGSVSKLFTATAVMQLAEQKKLKLNDDINYYLDKNLQIKNTYSQPVTFANILTHTDGFDFGWGIGVFASSKENLLSLKDFLQQNITSRIYAPGKVFLYGNVGMTIAGHIIEKISGISFNEYIKQNIFKPLEMKHSSFAQPLPEQLNKNLAIGYKYQNGKFVPRPFGYFQSPPAGSLSATSSDIAHFLIAHLQNGEYLNKRILMKESAEAMQEQQFTVNPNMAGATYGFYERFVRGERVIEHSGRLNGYNSLLMALPARNFGFFLVCNANGGKLINEFREEFLKNYFPERKQSYVPSDSTLTTPNFFTQLSGTYRLSQYAHTSIDKIGVLLGIAPEIKLKTNKDRTITFSSNPKEKWSKQTPLLFRSENQNNYITFSRINERVHFFRGDWAFLTFEKLAWYEPIKFQIKILIGCLAIFLLSLILYLVNSFWQFSILNNIINLPWLKELTIILALTNIIFTIGIYIAFRQLDFWEILSGFPKEIKLLLQLPKLSAFVSAALVALVVFAWIEKGNFGSSRVTMIIS
jgi:CubicO group peptidase (beta-lactamase class C family)